MMFGMMNGKFNLNSAPYISVSNAPITPLATQSTIANFLNAPTLPTSGEYKKIYVGKIPPGVSDTFMVKLLETCGPVASWKRGTDHNGKARGFGFCEYHSVESMLKSLRLLNHLKLEDGYELTVSYMYL
jgi:RNA recognition motif-containing protein